MPTTEVEGPDVVMPLVFPDVTRATIMYPRQVDLAGMGLQPDITLTWGGRWIGPITFAYGRPLQSLLDGDAPLAVHHRDGERIEEWKARRNRDIHYTWYRWLVLRAGDWTVHMPLDNRIEATEALRLIQPRVVNGGFVVVEARPPAQLSNESGEGGGPKLAFGDGHPEEGIVDPGTGGLLIELEPVKGPCQLERSVDGSYGAACLAGGRLTVNGTVFPPGGKDARGRLAEVINGIRVRNLDLR